jgi:hypothetical protein
VISEATFTDPHRNAQQHIRADLVVSMLTSRPIVRRCPPDAAARCERASIASFAAAQDLSRGKLDYSKQAVGWCAVPIIRGEATYLIPIAQLERQRV